MIEMRISFWTNDIAKENGEIAPRHAWTSGVVCIEANKSHGITSKKPRHFYSLLDIGAVIERVLLDHRVIVHPSRRMKKYVSRDEKAQNGAK
jgi:hypothetical protein